MGYSRESSGHLYNDAYLFCTGIIVVLDLSRKESLMVAHEMVNKAKQFYKSPLIVSVGNQQDLKHLREVSDDAFNALLKNTIFVVSW
ncbi:MAG TPA: GTPase domain-containing protein [Legionella sp.]|nr:GTPase domain-containing protein [Legionella sp.]